MQAIDIAAVKPMNMAEVLPAPCASLKDMPNVMDKFLNAETFVKGPQLPKSAVGVQRAAILTLQTWMARNPKAVGILFCPPPESKEKAKPAKKIDATSLVVGTGLGAIWNSQGVAKLKDFYEYVPLGVVVGGELEDGQLSADQMYLRKAWCTMLLAHGFPQNCFILAS